MSIDAGGILKQSPAKYDEQERGFGLLRPMNVGKKNTRLEINIFPNGDFPNKIFPNTNSPKQFS